MVKNQGSYNNANGASILDLIHPSDENGFYTFYNVSGIPESSNPASEYVRIIKMKEVMIVVCSAARTYIMTASSNSWNGYWYKFTVSEVWMLQINNNFIPTKRKCNINLWILQQNYIHIGLRCLGCQFFRKWYLTLIRFLTYNQWFLHRYSQSLFHLSKKFLSIIDWQVLLKL